eukprot:753086-Hanusia_phi.AAC.4
MADLTISRRVQLNDDTGSDSDDNNDNARSAEDSRTSERTSAAIASPTPKPKGRRLVRQATSDNSDEEEHPKEQVAEPEDHKKVASSEGQSGNALQTGSDDESAEKDLPDNSDKKRSLEMLAKAARKRKEESQSKRRKRVRGVDSPASKGSSPASKGSSPSSKGSSPASKKGPSPHTKKAAKRKKREKSKMRSKAKSKRTKKNTSKEENFEEKIVSLLQQQLKKIISKAVIEKDTTLTKRTCRDKLTEIFGEEMVEEFKGYINEQVASIVMHCQSISSQEVEEMHNTLKYVTTEDIDKLKQVSDESESEGENPDSSAESSSDESEDELVTPKKKIRKSKGKQSSGLFANCVVVLAGNYFANNKTASTELQELIALNGGKVMMVQSTVTKKVTHLVFSQNESARKSQDSRLKTARKHGAKIVLENFFKACIEQNTIVDEQEYLPSFIENSNSSPQGAEKSPEGRAEGREEQRVQRKPAIRCVSFLSISLAENFVRKTREELDWEKEYRMRFNYSKEARKRRFNVRDTIVPEDDSGAPYNAYLTKTEVEEEGDVLMQFFSIKLVKKRWSHFLFTSHCSQVEAGGLMKGEKWHLITQWGKVETEKPGCDVADYNDKNDAIAAFERRFWERTRNSWQSGSMSFRTHPGKFTLVDLSDDEDEENNSDAENDGEYQSNLEPSVQDLLTRIVSKASLEKGLTSMNLDSEKMPLQRVKRHAVHEALAELSLIQDIIKLQKGKDKQSGNDIRKLAKHSEKIRSIIPMQETMELETFETVDALKDKGKMLEELEDISSVISLRKRVKLSPSSQENLRKLDAFYEILETNIHELDKGCEDFSSVQKLFHLTSAQSESVKLNLERVFKIKRAGDDFRYKPFERLNNQKMLWRGGTASSITRSLAQGIQVPLQESPSANYPFGSHSLLCHYRTNSRLSGKGIYLFDCVNAAAERSSVSREYTSGFLLLCEAALGEQKEMKNACALRRAPHGFHSIFARGRISSDPNKANDFPAANGSNRSLQIVGDAPSTLFGSSSSCVPFNNYVVFDMYQVKPVFLVEFSRAE